MLMHKQKKRNTRMGTSESNAPYPPGLRILARMIALCYLKEKKAKYSSKEKHPGTNNEK
jgi:hypothetical protein